MNGTSEKNPSRPWEPVAEEVERKKGWGKAQLLVLSFWELGPFLQFIHGKSGLVSYFSEKNKRFESRRTRGQTRRFFLPSSTTKFKEKGTASSNVGLSSQAQVGEREDGPSGVCNFGVRKATSLLCILRVPFCVPYSYLLSNHLPACRASFRSTQAGQLKI